MALKQGKMIVVTSVKGGVGKTTTVLNLAGLLSNRKIKTLVIDLDLYGSAIGTSLNIESEKDVYKVINDLNNNQFTQLDKYVDKFNSNIDVLKAPKDPRLASKINSKYLNIIFSKAKLKYDVVLVDTNHIIDETNLFAFDAADEIFYILSNDAVDLKSMKTMVSIYKDMEKTNYKIILNNAKDRNRQFFEKFDIKSIIKNNVDYIIPGEFYLKNFDKMIIDGEIITLNDQKMRKYKKTNQILNLIVDSFIEKER